MATIFFNSANFRALFKPYADANAFPDSVLQIYWDSATAYVSNQSGGCYTLGMNLGQRVFALNLMTAHLTYLNTIANSGQNTGLMQGATIDKVSVTLTPPPERNQWQWWLNQSPYGQQLLALLQAASVGGGYFGGYPTSFALRR